METKRSRIPARAVTGGLAPGHWVPDMVQAAGGRCVLGRSGARSFHTTWDDLAASAAAGAAVVVCAPCGFGLDHVARLAGQVADRVPRRCPCGRWTPTPLSPGPARG